MDIEASVPAVVPQQGHNRIQVLLDSAAHLGGQSTLGVKALLQLGLTTIEAAQDDIIKPETAKRIAQRYCEGCAEAGGTPGSVKTLTSKLRKFVEIGNQYKDALTLAKEALRVRDEMAGTAVKPKSPFETLVEIARFYLKEKRTDLADDEIAAVIRRQKAEKETEQEQDDEPESPSYEIPWADILDSKNDREALIAFRKEIVARLRQIDRMLTETHAEENNVDEAANAPPAADIVQEDA